MSKWTPGKWKVYKTEWTTTIECERGYTVAILAPRDTGPDANARLIASAPELLETLKTLMKKICEDIPHKYQVFDFLEAMLAAQTAIKKAEGRGDE